MSATNARIVLLSGTPIINYPNEIGIMFNILRGYIKTWTFPIQLEEKGAKEKPSKENIMNWFEKSGLKTYDYLEYSGDQVTITRNPFGFVNVDYEEVRKGTRGGASRSKVSNKPNGLTKRSKKDSNRKTKKVRDEPAIVIENNLIKINHLPDDANESKETSEIYQDHVNPGREGMDEKRWGGAPFEDYEGVQLSLDDTGNISDEDFVNAVIRVLGDHGLKTNKTKIKVVNNKALPDNSKIFLEMFVELGSKEMKNVRVFQKRILGLTSFFKSAQEELLPRYNKITD
jgi:hypothetical protein